MEVRVVTASKAVDYISKMEHGVIIAVGSGKQGKSCSLHSLIDLCWHTRPVYLLDPMEYDVSMFPGYRRVSDPNDIPVGSVAVIEDVNRVFHSRGSGKETQSMAGTDIEFVRSQDAVVMCKRMHSEDIAFERPEFRINQALANIWIERSVSSNPQLDPRAWCFFPRFNECVAIPKVPWWSYRNSHMLREVKL